MYNDDNKTERGIQMAIGKITVRPVKTVRNTTLKQAAPKPAPPPPQAPTPPPPPPVQVNPFVVNNAVNRVSVCISAPTVAQAEDFLCGIYCNAVSDLGESGVVIYTRDRNTLSMLTAKKQYLQRISTRPAGTVIMGGAATGQTSTYLLTLANAGVQRGAVDIYFSCCTYSQLGAFSGSDIVTVLTDGTHPEDTGKTAAISSGRPVTYVITGFEKERTYYFEEGDAPPCEALRERLRQSSGIKVKAGDRVSYAQVYGGAEVTALEGGSPVYSISGKCRDYLPIGCGRVFFNLLRDFAIKRSIRSGVFAYICTELEGLLARDGAAREKWYEIYPEREDENK